MDPADILFPSMESADQPSVGPEQSTEERQADALHGDSQAGKPADQAPFMRQQATTPDQISNDTIRAGVPENVAQLRTDDAERAMYSPQKTYAEVIAPDMFDAKSEEFQLSDQAQTAILAEYREMAADMALTKQEVSLLHGRVLDQRNNPADPDQAYAQAKAQLVARYGKEGAQGALAAANKLLARDPRTKNLIRGWGLGNDPETIMTLVGVARREQSRGRL